ncbi:MAG: hypothetical protein NTW87_18260 [Planctomycetota bacterium]|nr:hypothetical protein [Planctomycetota bacterium]
MAGRALNAIPVCALILLLGGCVRYEETIAVDRNGKGTAEIVLSRPAVDEPSDPLHKLNGIVESRFSEQAMTNALPAGLACEYQRTASGGAIVVRAAYRFDDIATLIGWAAKADSPLGTISILRKDGGLEYSRAFGLLRKDEMGELRRYFPECQLLFKLAGPGTLDESNATHCDGSTAVWELKASDLFAGKSLTARYCYGSRWSWVYYFLAGLLVGAVARVVYRRLTRGQHQLQVAASDNPQRKG